MIAVPSDTPPTRKNKGGRPTGSKWVMPEGVAVKWATREEAAKLIGCSIRKLDALIAAEQSRLKTILYVDRYRLVSRTSISMYIAAETGEGLPNPLAGKAK